MTARLAALAACAIGLTMLTATAFAEEPTTRATERQVTRAPHGHVLTNVNAWTADSRRLAYDIRSDHAGGSFDGERIESVDVDTGEVRVLYESRDGAKCAVVTCAPSGDGIAFILGPARPTPDWQYGPSHRQGMMVRDGQPTPIDARDLTAPLTPGALRGGSHVHVFSPDGKLISFTYNDAILDKLAGADGAEPDQRNVGVSVLDRPVTVDDGHPRNHDGSAFSVLVTRTTATPTPGSDEIGRAFEDGWVGVDGYVRADGTRQRRAIAFQGEVTLGDGRKISEAYIVDLSDDLTIPGDDGPLQGTMTQRPRPPRGVVQRRLTRTADRKFPGIQGVRHWLRSSPDGAAIAILMRDDAGVAQLWTVSPNGGTPRQVTRDAWPVDSAFTWSPDGRAIAYVADGSVFTVDVATGQTARLTPKLDDPTRAPRPEACLISPDGKRVAYARVVDGFTQLFVIDR